MEDKFALVTGSNRGIGLECVRQLCERGYPTLLTSRRPEDGQQVMDQFKKFKDLLTYHQLDVTDDTSIQRIQAFIKDKWGRLDILINNAGINYDTWQQAHDADLENVMETLQTNLMGPWKVSQAFIPLMRKHKYGRIVNVSSGAGALKGMRGGTPGYGISKAALNALTIKLADELKGTGILVNAVCPGWVRTDMGGSTASRSVEKGAETIIWAALLPDSGTSGKFLRDKQEISF